MTASITVIGVFSQQKTTEKQGRLLRFLIKRKEEFAKNYLVIGSFNGVLEIIFYKCGKSEKEVNDD